MRKGSFFVGAIGGALLALLVSLVGFSIYHLRSNSYGEHIAFGMSGLPLMSELSLLYLRDCPDETLDLPEGESIVGRVMVFYGEENQALVDILIACGHSIEQPDAYGLRPLHAAVLSENEAAVRYLITKGADPEARVAEQGEEHVGQTVLEFAQALRAQAEDKAGLDGIIDFLTQTASR